MKNLILLWIATLSMLMWIPGNARMGINIKDGPPFPGNGNSTLLNNSLVVNAGDNGIYTAAGGDLENDVELPDDYFITTWKTDNPGTSNDNQITIPAEGGYIYTWAPVDDPSDTSVPAPVEDVITITFPEPGTYIVRMTPFSTLGIPFHRILFDNSGDKEKLLEITQWGNAEWSSMHRAFSGCSNLDSDATDTPDLANVTNMRYMFRDASAFNGDIGNWDVSNVTDMSYMFYHASVFNQDISNWNVENVTDMGGMFYPASAFDQDIGNWNVSNVTNMGYMFTGASAFNANIGNWDVSNVTNMTSMFYGVTLSTVNYDALLNGWNNLTLQNDVTFDGGNSQYCDGETARDNMINTFGWNITDGGESCDPADYFITTWKTDNPGTSNSTSIIIPTTGGGYEYDVDWKNDGNWETGFTGDATHDYVVAGTYEVAIRGDFPRIYFNDSGDKEKIMAIEQWGTSAWSSMRSAFHGCSNLDSDATDTPDLSNVTDMIRMFFNASSFDGDISNWDVSNVGNMYFMFYGASVFNKDIGNWDVSNVTNMGFMFGSASAFNRDIGVWDVSNVTNMSYMFNLASAFNGDISNWDVGSVTDMSYMFLGASSFNQDISNWDVSSVTNMDSMFRGGDNAFDQDLGAWDVSNVINMKDMFKDVTLSTTNYDATLIGWATLSGDETQIPTDIIFNGGNSQYCASEAKRQELIRYL